MRLFFIFLLMSFACFADKRAEQKNKERLQSYLLEAENNNPEAYYFLSNWYGLEDQKNINSFFDPNLSFYWAMKYFESGDCFSNASDQLLYLFNFNLDLTEIEKSVLKYVILKMRYDEAVTKEFSKKEIDKRQNLLEESDFELSSSQLNLVNQKIDDFKNKWKENEKELYWCSLD